MRFHTYTKFSPESADTVDLQALLDNLADFLLQSGFAGGGPALLVGRARGATATARSTRCGRRSSRRSSRAASSPPRCSRRCAATATRSPRPSSPSCSTTSCSASSPRASSSRGPGAAGAGRPPGGHRPGRPRAGRRARRAVRPHRPRASTSSATSTLRGICSARSASRSFGSHDTPHLATGIEADAGSKPYEFGDVLNLDVTETLTERARPHRFARRPDGPRLRRPDGAAGGVPLELRHGAHARLLALDDPLRRGPLHAGQEGGARAHAPHPHAVPRRHASRWCSSTTRAEEIPLGALAKAQVGPVPHEHGRGAQAGAPPAAGAEEGHAADRDDHRRQAERAHHARRADLQERDGARRLRAAGDAHRGGGLPEGGDPREHLHAGARPGAGGVREDGERDHARAAPTSRTR